MSWEYADAPFDAGERDIEDLQAALASNRVIVTAVGIVTHTNRVSTETAFASLRRQSQASNVKMRVIAQEIVDRANRQANPSG